MVGFGSMADLDDVEDGVTSDAPVGLPVLSVTSLNSNFRRLRWKELH